jgi:hypothetical protein
MRTATTASGFGPGSFGVAASHFIRAGDDSRFFSERVGQFAGAETE